MRKSFSVCPPSVGRVPGKTATTTMLQHSCGRNSRFSNSEDYQLYRQSNNRIESEEQDPTRGRRSSFREGMPLWRIKSNHSRRRRPTRNPGNRFSSRSIEPICLLGLVVSDNSTIGDHPIIEDVSEIANAGNDLDVESVDQVREIGDLPREKHAETRSVQSKLFARPSDAFG
ncbi:hypothetical protein KM043_003890 [Ampulex compressa]|nr:hypothetical protein KM043_003890 [Ampulex compressa]